MSRVRFIVLIILFLFVFAGTSMAGDAYWIDVRTAEEYGTEHVEDAANIPYEEIGSRISEITAEKDALIYVYCRSGRRSGIARETLMDAGYTNVINLGGLADAQKMAATETAR